MAIGRLSVGVGAKGKASPHAQYVAREGKYEKDPTVEKLEATGYGNMPAWAQAEPNFFWKMSDEYERKNGTSYREHVISLPRELDSDQRHELIKDWIAQEIGDKHAYQYAIHNPPAMDGGEQPHAHIMFSERLIDDIERDPDQYFKRYNSKNPERGGAKKANTPKLAAERQLELKQQRDRWEKLCNSHLELVGSKARINMKSYKDIGKAYKPLNLTMAQIKKPEIRESYIEHLNAKRGFFAAIEARKSIDVPSELSKQAEQAAERAAQAKLAEQAAERAAQAKLAEQAAERAAQAKLAEQAAERAAQAKLAEQAAERAAQAKQELDRISKRPLRELLRLEFRVVIKSEYGSTLRDTVARVSDNFYDMYRQAKREKYQIGIGNKYQDGTPTNPEIAGNHTAQRIERFMICRENLSNIDVLSDFESNMSVQDFTKKYSLECDLSDLKRLDELYPTEPKLEPKASNIREPSPKNDNDHGFSM